MDKLVEALLSIEQAANDSLAVQDKEQIAQARQAEADKTCRLQEIMHKTTLAIEALEQEAETSLTAELGEIKAGYRLMAAQLQELFNSNGTGWRKELYDSVLSQP